jgi:hypothetical protein
MFSLPVWWLLFNIGNCGFSVINQPTSAIAKLSTIAKIRKYKGLHEGNHFILMAMEVHGASEHDMDHFIRECARLFHNR